MSECRIHIVTPGHDPAVLAAIGASLRKQIDETKKRAAVQAIMEQAQAILAWTTRELHRVPSARIGRRRWRHGINRRKAVAKTMAAAMFGAVAAR